MKTINHMFIDNKSLIKFLKQNSFFKDQSLLIQIFTANIDKPFIKSLQKILKENIKNVKIIGTTTDGTIAKNGLYQKDTLLAFSIFNTTSVETHIQEAKTADSYELGCNLAKKSSKKNSNQKVAICFANGININGEEFLKGFQNYAKNITISGGLAADQGEFKKTYIFDANKITQKGAVVAILSGEKLIVNQAFNFGWEKIGKEFLVTKSIGNRVYTLNNIPIIKIYKKYLGIDIANNIPSIGVEFPLILNRNGINIGRSTIKKHKDNSLSYAGNINAGEKVQFGYGNTINILHKQEINIDKLLKTPIESIFIYSCMARKKLLLNDVNKELKPYSKISNVSGFFTHGEFYTDKFGNYHFLNETKTILTLSESEKTIKTKKFKTIQKNKKQIATLNALSNLISKTTQEYINLNKNLSVEISLENAKVKAILDSSPSIITVFENGFIKDANLAFFRFFNNVSTIEEFNQEYNCLCDLFYDYKDFDSKNYLKSIYIDGIYWLDYILSNDTTKYKVAIKKEHNIYHFMINVKKVENLDKTYVVEFIDLTNYISFQKEISIKDQMLLQQSKLAAMGEMIGMIAHQWRQPLTAISSVSNTLLIKNELDTLDKELLRAKLENINSYTQHLSHTIDDFRNFFKTDKELHETSFVEIMTNIENIIKDSLAHNNIKLNIELFCAEEKFKTFPNELKQVVLNLVKNSKDAILENQIEDGLIDISNFDDGNYRVLKITDNAGGIPIEIHDKIFEPYFTTKEKKDGTGIGLYMSKIIIEEHLNGNLTHIPEPNGSTFLIRLKA